MRFTDGDAEPYPDDEDMPEVFNGVADIAVVGHWIGWKPTPPIVCFGVERYARASPGDHVASLSDAVWRMRMEQPGAFDERSDADTASQSDYPGTMSGTMTPASTVISNVGPSSVGGLWEDEEFVQWGPGHVEGCGHDIGREIFE
jgi:hypothetical protein